MDYFWLFRGSFEGGWLNLHSTLFRLLVKDLEIHAFLSFQIPILLLSPITQNTMKFVEFSIVIKFRGYRYLFLRGTFYPCKSVSSPLIGVTGITVFHKFIIFYCINLVLVNSSNNNLFLVHISNLSSRTKNLYKTLFTDLLCVCLCWGFKERVDLWWSVPPFLYRGRCRSSGRLTQTATGGSVDCNTCFFPCA